MYGMNYSGGANRTHGQIERAERIDSFEAGKVEGWGTIFTNSMVPLDCGHFMEDDGEIVELLSVTLPRGDGELPCGWATKSLIATWLV